MNPYVFDADCNVCGGPGKCTARDISGAWTGQTTHKDPTVCRYYLDKKKKEVEEKINELKELVGV